MQMNCVYCCQMLILFKQLIFIHHFFSFLFYLVEILKYWTVRPIKIFENPQNFSVILSVLLLLTHNPPFDQQILSLAILIPQVTVKPCWPQILVTLHMSVLIHYVLIQNLALCCAPYTTYIFCQKDLTVIWVKITMGLRKLEHAFFPQYYIISFSPLILLLSSN